MDPFSHVCVCDVLHHNIFNIEKKLADTRAG